MPTMFSEDSSDLSVNVLSAGAGRLELCSSLLEGGITPSIGELFTGVCWQMGMQLPFNFNHY